MGAGAGGGGVGAVEGTITTNALSIIPTVCRNRTQKVLQQVWSTF